MRKTIKIHTSYDMDSVGRPSTMPMYIIINDVSKIELGKGWRIDLRRVCDAKAKCYLEFCSFELGLLRLVDFCLKLFIYSCLSM